MHGPKENAETVMGPSGEPHRAFSISFGDFSVSRFYVVVMTLITSSWT